ncbi:MAG: hypothetical protein WC602_06495, partial [archaeon]
MRNVFFVGIGIILVALAAVAGAQVLTPAQSNIYLERGTAYNLAITVSNPSQNESLDVALYAMASSNDISAEFSQNNDNRKFISLAANESTVPGLLIDSEISAPNGAYTITLRADYNGTTETRTINVYINQQAQIQIGQLSSMACLDYSEAAIKIAVGNNTASTASVLLLPEEESYLPRANPSYLELLSNAEKRVDVKLSVPEGTKIGDKGEFYITAKTANAITKKKLYFTWVSCAPVQKDFSLNVAGPVLGATNCLSISKNTADSFKFRAYSQNSETASLGISATGGFDYNLSADRLDLNPNSYSEFTLTGLPDSGDAAGNYYFDVSVQTISQGEKARVCFNVLPEHGLKLNALDQNREIVAGKIGTFAFEVQNFGDYNETIALNATTQNDVQATLSDPVLQMKPYEKRAVYLGISPVQGAQTGYRSAAIKATLGSTGLSVQKTAQFTIIEKPKTITEGTIRIVSYPQTINISQGAEKKIVVTIDNPSTETMRNISVGFEGLPSNVYFPSLDLRELGAGQSAKLIGNLKAADNLELKNFEAKIRAQSDSYYAEESVQFNVSGKKASGTTAGTGILTGFFGLTGGSFALFLVLISIAIIIFFYALHVGNRRHKNGLPIVKRASR